MRRFLINVWLVCAWGQYTSLKNVANDNKDDTTSAYRLQNGMEVVLVANEEYVKTSVALHVKHTKGGGSGEACAALVRENVNARVRTYAMVASTLFRMDFKEKKTEKILKALAKAVQLDFSQAKGVDKPPTQGIRKLMEQALERESNPSHPYSYAPEGSCKNYYYPSNMRLVVASTMPHGALIELISSTFSSNPPRKSLFKLASPFKKKHKGIVLCLSHDESIAHLQFQTHYINEAYQLKYILGNTFRIGLHSLDYTVTTYIQRVSPSAVLFNLYFVQQRETGVHQYYIANAFFNYINFLKTKILTDELVHPPALPGVVKTPANKIAADFSIRSLFLPLADAFAPTGLFSPLATKAFQALLNSFTPQSMRLVYTVPEYSHIEVAIAPEARGHYRIGKINSSDFGYSVLDPIYLSIPKPFPLNYDNYRHQYITHDMDRAAPSVN